MNSTKTKEETTTSTSLLRIIITDYLDIILQLFFNENEYNQQNYLYINTKKRRKSLQFYSVLRFQPCRSFNRKEE